MAIITVHDLYKSFRVPSGSAIEALREISFDVQEGEFVSIVGPSGCGKTTLIHMIDGLVPPSSGRILVRGQPVPGPGRDRSLVFQEYALLPWRTVAKNIELPLEIQGISAEERSEVARHFLGLVGLSEFADRHPYELSGGMRQRVAIARALASGAEILLMDEPFANLDAQTRYLMEEELLRIWERTRRTVLFVTHDLAEAIALSDRVLVISARPGMLKQAIPIRLPRPRDVVEVRSTEAFGALHNQLWKEIHDEVLRSMRMAR